MRKLGPSLLFTFATLALVSVAEPAAAGDSKLAGGSFCAKVGTQDAFVGAADFIRDGLLNATSATQKIACPLVRDSGDQPFTALFARMYDTRVAGITQFVPRCRVHALSADGTDLDSSAWVTHGNPSSDGANRFDSLSVVDEMDVSLNGSASVECDLGAHDTMVGMRWEEDETSISGDTKIIPGTACRSFGRVTPGFVHGAGWFNAPAGGGGAECPIVRDNSSSELLGAWVRLDLAATTDVASCRLMTQSITGSSSGKTDWVDITGGGSLFIDGDDVSSHFSNSSYWVLCDLPAGAHLLSVRWDEA